MSVFVAGGALGAGLGHGEAAGVAIQHWSSTAPVATPARLGRVNFKPNDPLAHYQRAQAAVA